ncbi:UNVERIFIED_CONTAM: hypothetical protein GTU68_000988 [Idotea baltica]|nr:hypothetical protein [Idotea baltica]
MDGSQIGELEYENFNAASAIITINGKSVHPGYAKGKMVNSILVANRFLTYFPFDEIPEKTSGYEGFFHLHSFSGTIEKTTLAYIIRDHDTKLFEKRKQFIYNLVNEFNNMYSQDVMSVKIEDQYYNMKEKIVPVLHIVDLVEEVFQDIGIKPIIKAIRGGTDGSQLSFKGLPCPNIFAGGHNFHGKYEYVPVESMLKAIEVIVNIVKKVPEKYV